MFMVYKVKQKIVYDGKVFLPGSLIKLSKDDLLLYADKIEKLTKHTKVIK